MHRTIGTATTGAGRRMESRGAHYQPGERDPDHDRVHAARRGGAASSRHRGDAGGERAGTGRRAVYPRLLADDAHRLFDDGAIFLALSPADTAPPVLSSER